MKRFLLSFVFVLFLAGCLVPEQFSAEVKVSADGSYTFKYAGVTAYLVALSKVHSSDKDNSLYQADAEKMLRRPEFKKAEYLNNGRYDLEIEYHKKPGESLKMFDVFSVSTDKDGIMTISTVLVKPKDRQQLEQVGVAVDGKLSVTLPSNVEVISHNATSTPYFFGLFGNYIWDITSFEQQPMMKVKINTEH